VARLVPLHESRGGSLLAALRSRHGTGYNPEQDRFGSAIMGDSMPGFKPTLLAGALFGWSCLVGCPAANAPTQSPTYSWLSSNVFIGCSTSSCHSSFAMRGNLVLEPSKGYAQLVGVAPDNDQARADGLQRVKPGDPDHSFLLIKLNHPKSGYGSQMPQNGVPLDATTIATIRQWIANGAPNN